MTDNTTLDQTASTVVTTEIESSDSTSVESGAMELALTEVFVGGQAGGASLPSGGDPYRAVVPFAFGDASPAPVFTAPAGCTSMLARLVIDTPFNGAGASLKLGTSANPEALIAAAHNDPTQVAGYESVPDAALASGDEIVLTITPGTGATQGAGRIIFDSIAA